EGLAPAQMRHAQDPGGDWSCRELVYLLIRNLYKPHLWEKSNYLKIQGFAAGCAAASQERPQGAGSPNLQLNQGLTSRNMILTVPYCHQLRRS
ncbi:hypothetical protein, partial [Herbaspirillum sp. B65]|uniref:hypothetical protein n=1 Tax=Herbaspirillum sp. B65 TaxID=137708 RepID=UPI001C2555D8